MFNFLKAAASGDPRSANAKTHNIPEGQPVRVEYIFNDVSIPDNFLRSPDAVERATNTNITLAPIDWATTPLPENAGRYAVVLDNVLSPSECRQLIELAEASVDLSGDDAAAPQNPWRPAMVAAGSGYEVLDSRYRNSDRIVWDRQEIVDRLWARCLQGRVGETLLERLAVLDNDETVVGVVRGGKDWETVPQRWEMRRLNRRMRFLKYGPGQFFRPHCDSHYSATEEGKVLKTFFTLQVYLNDSVAEAGKDAELVGGATSFVSSDGKRKINVDPKAGRILLFQHRGLNHAGDDVTRGTKYTMRAEIMYEMV